MNLKAPRPGLKLTVIVIVSFGLICVIVSGLQPIFDALIGDGTLFATTAAAEEQDLSAGDAIAEQDSTSEGDPAQQSQSSSLEIFRDAPLARLAVAIQARQFELGEKAKALDDREQRLDLMQASIEQKLDELKSLRQEFEREKGEFESRTDSKRVKEIKKWVAIYEGMGPIEAATLLVGVDDSLALEILPLMVSKKAASILDAMVASDEQRAIALGKGLEKSRR